MRTIIFILMFIVTMYSCRDRIIIEEKDIVQTEILDNCFISAIEFDKTGAAWVGTFQNGLIRYSEGTVEYMNSKYPELPTTILDIQTDSKGNLWMGYGNGIIKFNGSTVEKYHSANTPLPDYPVTSIAIDKNDHIWFTCCIFKKGGIVKYDGTNWTLFTPENSSLPVNFVQSIAVDGGNNVWLAVSQTVNEPYLVKISGDKWTIYNKNDFGFTPYYFSKIAVNSANEIFCGIDYSLASTMVNSGSGLLKFDGHNFDRIDIDDNFIVKSIKIDKTDKIWSGDLSGKNKYGVFYGQSWLYNEAGLAESVVTVIEQAKDGKMWLGTESGIHVIPAHAVNISTIASDYSAG